MIRIYLMACFVVVLSGCEKLENQLVKPNLALQEQCARQAQLEFTNDGFGTKQTVRYSFTDHYNPALNKCFIEEYVGNSPDAMKSKYSSIFISDVYEHRQYASFGQPLNKGEEPTDCEVTTLTGIKVMCKSEDEFNKLVKRQTVHGVRAYVQKHTTKDRRRPATAAVDVSFEFKMLRQASGRLDVSSPSLGHNNSGGDFPLTLYYNPSGSNAPIATLVGPTTAFHDVEGVLVHFRNLIEFFFTNKAYKDDLVLAHHYTGQTPQQLPAWAKTYEQRCNELLAHLTYRRSNHYRQNDEHHWPDIAEKCRLMENTITEFLNSLPPEKRAWFK